MGWAVYDIGASVPQGLVGTLGKHPVVAHVAHEVREVVIINQFGVAEDPRLLTEELLDLPAMHLDLRAKLLARVEKRERVVICFVKKLHAPGLIQRRKSGQRVRGVLLELFERASGDGIGDSETSVMPADGIQQGAVGREIADLCQPHKISALLWSSK